MSKGIMSRGRAVAVVVATAALGGGVLGMSATSGAQDSPAKPTSGPFSLVMMIHTNKGDAPARFGPIPPTRPWNGVAQDGQFSYSSIPCTGNAPVNNIASDLPTYNGRVEGSRAPASMRAHPFRFRVKQLKSGKGKVISGRIDFTVCKLGGGPNAAPDPVADVDKPKIYVTFRAEYKPATVEQMPWVGTFKIIGGTGRYADLTGSGTIGGYFMCFAAGGCMNTGKEFDDGQFTMQGRYSDPTPNLTESGNV